MVSVCIRAHDRPASLGRTIESALAQTHVDLEVVVSDDTGSSEAMARTFTDERVRYHRASGPAGPAANLRFSFSRARGSFLALLDDDDRWHPEFLATALAPFEREPGLGIVFTDFNMVAGDRQMRRTLDIAPGRHDSLLAEILAGSPITPSAAILRRAVWEEGEAELPLLDHALGAFTIWVRAAAAGWPFYYIDEALMDYTLHPGQISSGRAAPARLIALFERMHFSGRYEALRLDRLAYARMAQARFDLRAGRLQRAARRIRVARQELGAPLTAGHWLELTGLPNALSLSTLRRPALRAVLRSGWLHARGLRPPRGRG